MAAAKTKKRSIIIGNKEYTMPQKMSTMAYLRYLEVRDITIDNNSEMANPAEGGLTNVNVNYIGG